MYSDLIIALSRISKNESLKNNIRLTANSFNTIVEV